MMDANNNEKIPDTIDLGWDLKISASWRWLISHNYWKSLTTWYWQCHGYNCFWCRGYFIWKNAVISAREGSGIFNDAYDRVWPQIGCNDNFKDYLFPLFNLDQYSQELHVVYRKSRLCLFPIIDSRNQHFMMKADNCEEGPDKVISIRFGSPYRGILSLSEKIT